MPQVRSLTNYRCRTCTSAKEVVYDQTGIVVRQGGEDTSAEPSERHVPGVIVHKLLVQSDHVCEVAQAHCSRCKLLWTMLQDEHLHYCEYPRPGLGSVG
jgi:hypothetical protein